MILVRADPRPWFWERRLQMRVSPGLRIPIRRPYHVLWRSTRRIWIPEHHERQGNSLRLIQVPPSRSCWHKGTTRTHIGLHPLCAFLRASPSTIEAAILSRAIAPSRLSNEFSSTRREKSPKSVRNLNGKRILKYLPIKSFVHSTNVQTMPSNYWHPLNAKLDLSLRNPKEMCLRIISVGIPSQMNLFTV